MSRGRGTLLHFLQGLLMGGADIIPGVSGGTMALIVGIYERLVSSIRAFAATVLGLARGRRADARARLGEVEWGLVLPLAAGVLTALLSGARLIPGILERYPVESRAVFFGLILGSLWIPWKRIHAVRGVHYVAAVLGAAAAFLLVGLPPSEIADPPLPVVFGAAAIAICAMILPGVSGSFLLYVLGLYTVTLEALNRLDLAYIATFVAGCAIGLGTFSKLLDYLLRRHHDLTMAVLVGLMAGSLRALWPWQTEARAPLAPPADATLLSPLALGLLGLALVIVLGRMGGAAIRRSAGGTPERR